MSETSVTPKMIAAAWSAWHSRHGGKLGPGPAFVEAINAAIEAMPRPSIAFTAAVDDYNNARNEALEVAAEKVDGLRGIFYQSEGEITHARAFIKDILRDLATAIRALKSKEGGE